MAYLGNLCAYGLNACAIHGGLVGSESSLRWPRPTRPGDRIHH